VFGTPPSSWLMGMPTSETHDQLGLARSQAQG